MSGTIDYNGETWNYAFVQADGILTHEDREVVVHGCVDLYKRNKKRASIKGTEFEGELTNTRQTVRLGSYAGNCITGKLETDKGTADISVILWQYAPAEWN